MVLLLSLATFSLKDINVEYSAFMSFEFGIWEIWMCFGFRA